MKQKTSLEDQALNHCHDCHPRSLKNIVPNAPFENAEL